MILFIAVAGWIFLLAAIGFILKDFSGFIISRTFQVHKKGEFIDYGEYTSTWFGVFVIAVSGFIFYKVGTAFLAYLLSGDLISFFRLMRGVYAANSEVQSPFTLTHFLSGMLGQNILLFATCYIIYRGIRFFMHRINVTYANSAYDEGDVLYFGFFSTLIFLALEIFSYTQQMPKVSGTIHLFYLAMAKLSLVCYFVAVSHIHLARNPDYRKSLPQYLQLNPKLWKIVFSPKLTVIATLGIGMVLNAPLYFGTQFLESNFMVIGFALLSFYLFYKVIKRIISKAYNYFGAIMFFDANSPLIQPMSFSNPGLLQRKKIVYMLAGLVITMLILIPKLLVFFSFFIISLALLFLIFHLLIYVFGLGFSFLISAVKNQKFPKITRKATIDYLMNTATSLGHAVLPTALIVILAFLIFSFFPKKYEFQAEKNLVNRVIDQNNYSLFISRFDGNSCSPVRQGAIPRFMVDCIQWQEDRDFDKQQSWWPKWSNWHGISIASIYRMASGTGGGSNLNMQLIKNEAFPGTFPQDFQRKYTEMLSAYQLSIQLTPKEILTQYLNEVGMVGGVGHQGVVLAAGSAFQRPLQELNKLELMYLVSSLKRSSNFKTADGYIKYSDAKDFSREIKQTLIEQAELWQKQGLLSLETLKELRGLELRFGEINEESNIAVTTREFIRLMIPENDAKGYTYISTLSIANQNRMDKAVRRFKQYFRQHQRVSENELYAAAIVVDVSTGNVIGHYGGQGITDLTSFAGGSPMGSVIKPFILMEMLENNISENELKLYDGKIKGKFTPNNYSRRYSNRLRGINDIISKSLNAPMVNVRQITDPISLYKQLENRFASIGIQDDQFLNIDDPQKSPEHEVNYPLGSRNMTVFDIAQAYQPLLNDGYYQELKLFERVYDPFHSSDQKLKYRGKHIYDKKNCEIMKEALHHTMLKGGTGTHISYLLPKNTKFFAKTGTSDKGIHGYTVLSDGDILIVSYATYGRIIENHLELNDTPAIPHESGVRSAGILAAYIYNEWDHLAMTSTQVAMK